MQPGQIIVSIDLAFGENEFIRAFEALLEAWRQDACGCGLCRRLGAFSYSEARASLEQNILANATHQEIQVVRDTLAQGALGYSVEDCVIAVIARQRGRDYYSTPLRAIAFEGWLGRLPNGATPETNPIAQQLDQWLAEWQETHPPASAAAEPAEPSEVFDLEPGLDRCLVLEMQPRVIVLDRVIERTEAERWLRREPLGIARTRCE